MLKLPKDLFHDINLSDHTVTIRARDRDGSVKESKIWMVTAQNVEDARKVLSFEVHTLLIDEWAECELEIWRFLSGSVRSHSQRISPDDRRHPRSWGQALLGTQVLRH
jgi:hypothetical protein